MIEVDNIAVGGEVPEVYQRCVLVSGKVKCMSEVALEKADSYITTEVLDDDGKPLFPQQRWPMHHGHFKALVLLSPGRNTITLSATLEDGPQDLSQRTTFVIRYTPLHQTPPLHLAIMVAKDSPLLMDCPPAKFGGVSSAHSSLDAAIAKFRMTAYMWQALTAEDFRAKGLGRRSFRLEEEWTTDTLSQQSLHSSTTGTVPKVHLIRTTLTVAELRDAHFAQQNPSARNGDGLHKIFSSALLAHGAPFTSHTHPIVAGLILDSQYDLTDSKFILGHAALGSHDPKGLSLGMFGSHLTYAWPRFLEEVPSCLLDPTPPGDTVGNDNGECDSMWRACAVGQGAFLHEVGHAFGAPHTEGIMMRGYSPHWPKAFLGCVRGAGGRLEGVTSETKHDCRWGVTDALRFKRLRHFWVPGDGPLSDEVPTIDAERGEDGERESAYFEAKCGAGIAAVVFTTEGGTPEKSDKVSVAEPAKSVRYLRQELAGRFRNGKPLAVEVTAMNGKQYSVGNVWNLVRDNPFIRVPGTNIRLEKQGFSTGSMANQNNFWEWAVMLKKRNAEGQLVDANMVDIRVGCALDGARVYYTDGKVIPCGRRSAGNDPGMGGHQARKLALPAGVEITKVAVTRTGIWDLHGLRMWLSDGKAMGALNCKGRGVQHVHILAPPSHHKIVGFYGASGNYGLCIRFGIITAPRDVVLPDSVYDMEELQNRKPAQEGHREKRRRTDNGEEDNDVESSGESSGEDTDDTSSSEEGQDEGYDDGSDSEMDVLYQRQRDGHS